MTSQTTSQRTRRAEPAQLATAPPNRAATTRAAPKVALLERFGSSSLVAALGELGDARREWEESRSRPAEEGKATAAISTLNTVH